MAAPAEPAGGKAAGGTGDAPDTKDMDYMKLSRRRIYFNRLIGDDVQTPQKKAIRVAPWRVVFRFVIYTVGATWVIVVRSSVTPLAEINLGLKKVMRETAWAGGSSPRRFDDIESLSDTKRWMTAAFLPQLFTGMPYGMDYSLLSSNRVAPQQGVCNNSASVLLTVRRMKTIQDAASTTTSKFSPLYPEVLAGRFSSESSFDPNIEDDQPMRRSFVFNPPELTHLHGENNDPELIANVTREVGAYRERAARLPAGSLPLESGRTANVEWHYTEPGTCIPSASMECPEHGHKQNGGYVALLMLHLSSLQRFIRADGQLDPSVIDEIVNTQYVFLINTPAPDIEAGAPRRTLNREEYNGMGICEHFDLGEEAGTVGPHDDVMLLRDFLDIGFIDRQTVSLAMDFSTYNANVQALSTAQIIFNVNAAGVLDSKSMSVNTMMLDLYHPYMSYIEFFYIGGTFVYFVELMYRVYKQPRKHLGDWWAWCNIISICSSSASLILWYLYKNKHSQFLSEITRFPGAQLIQVYIADFIAYNKAMAFATLTIYIRMLQFLANKKVRVKLLIRTLEISAYNMSIYISFIVVVFVGFYSFAFTHFAAFSAEFASLPSCFVSCFMMFLGNTSPMWNGASAAPLAKVFLVIYMMVFFFISVQMFNAIINYSYNRVSEEMEPQFERERNERRRKELAQKFKQNKFSINHVMNCLSTMLKKKKKTGKDDLAKDEDKEKKVKGEKTPLDDVDESVKERVKEYLEKDKNQKNPDTICSALLFLLFASSYLLFLYINLAIPDNYQVKTSVLEAVTSTDIPIRHQDGSNAYLNFDKVTTLSDLSTWMFDGLPTVVFGSSVRTSFIHETDGEEVTIPAANSVCLNTWNCLVPGNNGDSTLSAANEKRKMFRITQRVFQDSDNGGTASADSQASAEAKFTTGSIIVPRRTSAAMIAAGSGASDFEDSTSANDLVYDGETFCERDQSGGYGRKGGLVCNLDHDPTAFMGQIEIMRAANWINHLTATVSIEFITFNGNAKILLYCALDLTVLPSGEISKGKTIESFVLYNLNTFQSQPSGIALKLLPGIVYIILVFYFSQKLLRDLRNECYRKKHVEGKTPLTTTFEHFTTDIFNALDAISISISLVSILLFLMWLIAEVSLKVTHETESYGDFLEYVGVNLASSSMYYAQLSSFNVLVMSVRALKFVRENPRMAKLNETLSAATTDTSWFVLVLTIVLFGFTLFAFVSFGSQVPGLMTIVSAFTYCFYYILGDFDYWVLNEVDPLMATLFFFPFLMLFYCMFMNIFFAIIDRYFITADPAPINFKRKLKPIFGKLCRCIEWDEDYVMEQDPNAPVHLGPPSRRSRVHKTQCQIQEIKDQASESSMGSATRRSKMLSDVCDVDEKMTEVIHWSKEEAKRFVEKWTKFVSRKGETKNEEVFLRTEVLVEVDREKEESKLEMEDAERHKKYNVQVHERIQVQDQETLSKYILLLEYKIQKKMLEKNALRVEVQHLRGESEMMRYDATDLKDKENETSNSQWGGGGGAAARPGEGEAALADAKADGDDDDSDADGEMLAIGDSAGPGAAAIEDEAPAQAYSDNPNALVTNKNQNAASTKGLSDALGAHLKK